MKSDVCVEIRKERDPVTDQNRKNRIANFVGQPETKAFATANTVTDTHLGTTGQRVHNCSITISNLDSIAADDYVALKVYRNASSASDTITTSDVGIISVVLSYSDT